MSMNRTVDPVLTKEVGRPAAEATGKTPVALAFDDVCMTYPDGTRAFENVSFTIERGEFVTILGPSGCGKSTVLKVAAGLEKHTSGEVTVPDSNVGFVFQDPTLLPWRTVRRNVELFSELHKTPKRERQRLASEAIDLVGLQGFENHYPKRLSGGMRMRASLARSLTRDPALFLFDEPFAALDEISRQRLNEEVLKIFTTEQFGGLFITHSVFEAVFMSTRVLVMSARPGRIIAEFDIPFALPRGEDLRFDADFAALGRELSAALKGAYK